MIPARQIASYGMSWPDMRRYGRQLAPSDADWGHLDRRSEVGPGVALALVLVGHLVEKHVLHDQEALSTVAFYMERVTRYAQELFDIVLDIRTTGCKTEDVQVPVVMLEVVEGRWTRLGQGTNVLFDIEEQREVNVGEVTKNRPRWAALWSHSVCLTPLFFKVCPVDPDHGDEYGTPEDITGEDPG